MERVRVVHYIASRIFSIPVIYKAHFTMDSYMIECFICEMGYDRIRELRGLLTLVHFVSSVKLSEADGV
jgi:hypothetical protein